MKSIQELESEVWKNIELATRDRNSERLANFNSLASRIQRVKDMIEGIERDVFSKKEIDEIPQVSVENGNYNVHHLPPNGTECRFIYSGKEYDGVIKNGKLEVSSYGSFKSFSGASVEITKTSRNGWKDWELKIPGSTKWITAYSWRRKNNSKDNH
jgi:hypothetical protein